MLMMGRKALPHLRAETQDRLNLVYSPYSLYVGVQQLHAMQGKNFDRQLAHLTGSLRATKATQLANALYTNPNNSNIDPDTVARIMNDFQQLDPLAGLNPTAYEAEQVNAWIAQQTAGTIRNVLFGLPKDGFGVNAIYFKSYWTHKFDATRTSAMSFINLAGEQVQVPMMNQATKTYYVDETAEFPAQVLGKELGEGYLMAFVLPAFEDGSLAKVEQALVQGQDLLGPLVAAIDQQAVSVYLPKFIIPADQLLNVTEALGEDRRHSTILHTAGFEINEEGAEGAAVTIVRTRGGGGAPQFYANRPFYVIFYHMPTGAELFKSLIGDPAIAQ